MDEEGHGPARASCVRVFLGLSTPKSLKPGSSHVGTNVTRNYNWCLLGQFAASDESRILPVHPKKQPSPASVSLIALPDEVQQDWRRAAGVAMRGRQAVIDHCGAFQSLGGGRPGWDLLPGPGYRQNHGAARIGRHNEGIKKGRLQRSMAVPDSGRSNLAATKPSP
jgi:hypothetical protein